MLFNKDNISIGFSAKNKDMNLGSYRIFINDLNSYFKELGIKSKIGNINAQVIIHPKSESFELDSKKFNGIVNPNADEVEKLEKADFAIVGSVEERESIIPHIKNAYIFPQIEKMYLNQELKQHTDKDEIVIGYHGNPNHLNHFSIGLKNALERLSQVRNIKLHVIKSKLSPIEDWKVGIPNIPMTYSDWNLKTISNDIKKFDIGIVPNISQYKNGSFKDEITELGIYNTDIQIRFKNKSNIGRSLVLIQHGIPVIADLTPSNMSLFSNLDNGYAVLTEEGWYQALLKLISAEHRNFISQNAYKEYQRQYDPLKFAGALYKNIEKAYFEKSD
jgi:glycosyltransferase involved in cell wall biosynthesis